MNQLPFASRYDAIVIGARCAGAATAMLLARSGLRVLVADRSEYGADTLSTHALMRGAVLQLRVLERLSPGYRLTSAGSPGGSRRPDDPGDGPRPTSIG